MPLGQGDYQYELVEGWPNLPEGWEMNMASDAAIDSTGNIYVFTRGKHPIMVFDTDGNSAPHGATANSASPPTW